MKCLFKEKLNFFSGKNKVQALNGERRPFLGGRKLMNMKLKNSTLISWSFTGQSIVTCIK